MYIILLHVSGIALLEILFYFEYIGHVESQLFKNSIIRILNEPYNEEHKYIIFTPNITFADINKYIDLDDIYNDDLDKQNSINNYMNNLNTEGEKKRKKHNNDLYVKTIYYWIGLFGFTLVVMFIQLRIKSYYKEKNKTISITKSEQNLELIHMRLRNSSIDDNENKTESEDENDDHKKKLLKKQNNINWKKIRNKVFYYLLFAAILLGFEFCFFQYIVLQYEPLSSNELQYLMYETLYLDMNTDIKN
jgi:hypothetical protein